MTGEEFTGWSPAAADFYLGLEADNSKAYWTSHKELYETQVLAPMLALIAELADEFGDGKVFRPYRDVRFSQDKSPYKAHIGALLERGYVQFSASGLGVAAGYHTMAPDQLDRFRAAVANDDSGPALEEAIAAVEARDLTVVSHDTLKTAPRGYPKEHPRIELLRRKNLATWREWPADTDWIRSRAVVAHVADALRASRVLGEWLDEYVGPSLFPSTRR
ncbi:DUF2461 domain-containing protein [Leifsonia sp. Le1]|uniref:DUF2461 domain-containing protein n=1 Tax=Leifsonia sp. Le1 TaxID=3404918 RepID=UPI003EBEC0D8